MGAVSTFIAWHIFFVLLIFITIKLISLNYGFTRELSVRQRQMEHKNEVGEILGMGEPIVRLVVSSLNIQDTVKLMNELPSFIEKLPNVSQYFFLYFLSSNIILMLSQNSHFW